MIETWSEVESTGEPSFYHFLLILFMLILSGVNRRKRMALMRLGSTPETPEKATAAQGAPPWGPGWQLWGGFGRLPGAPERYPLGSSPWDTFLEPFWGHFWDHFGTFFDQFYHLRNRRPGR